MGCNCKKKIALEDEYGVKEEETLFGKTIRILMKTFTHLLLIVLTLVTVPVVTLMIIYTIVFKKNNRLVLPKFLGKYLKK